MRTHRCATGGTQERRVPTLQEPVSNQSCPKRFVILAGGAGTRLSEHTYAHLGLTDFIISAGYKGHLINDYFERYHTFGSDVSYDLGNNTRTIHRATGEPRRVCHYR